MADTPHPKPPSPASPPRAPIDPDDEGVGLDLPPIDDDNGDTAMDDTEDPLLVDEGAADPDDILTGGDDTVELDDDPSDARSDDPDAVVDTGPDEDLETTEESATADDDAVGAADPETDGVDDVPEALDDGAEGTSELPEDAIDEALPELDDDEDAPPEGDLGATLLVESDAGLPPLARVQLGIIDGAGATLPCRVVVAKSGVVAAAGATLLVVEDGALAARALSFGEKVVAVALSDDAVLAATARGELLTTHDGTRISSSLAASRGATASDIVELVATSGRLWMRSGSSLSEVAAPAQGRAVVREPVVAIAGSGSTLLAITQGADGTSIQRLRGDDEGSRETQLTGVARAVVDRGKGPLAFKAAHDGESIALGSGDRIAVSRDGGQTFASIEIGTVLALTFGEENDATLIALVAHEGSRTAYVVACVATREPRRIGEIHDLDASGGVGIAWDVSRGLLWVATSAGLVALGVPTRH